MRRGFKASGCGNYRIRERAGIGRRSHLSDCPLTMAELINFLVPDSPEFNLVNHELETFDLGKDVSYESPQRKRRTRKDSEPKSRKRKSTAKKDTAPATIAVLSGDRNGPDRGTNNHTHETYTLDLEEEEPWEFEPSIVTQESRFQTGREASLEEENYLEFLDAVSADEDMVIRISREVFVVLGWTTEATVSRLETLRGCVLSRR